jgi:2-polyprenyl-3-methyl-5-hydroxy-6-metoxy-1,4-benzoquinol methylase
LDYSQLYYKCQRPDLIRYIKSGKNRILDVGCAEGLLGESLKQQGLASKVVGIELFPDAAKVAASRLDQIICGDIELMSHDEMGLERESFDYIICGDVLEHLRDPWTILSWLTTLLKKDGRLIASVPNVRHWSVMLPLLFQNEWKYQTHGIMDQTHLRFFTKKSAIQMLTDSGLQLVSCEGSKLRSKKDRLMNLLLLGMGKSFVSVQWSLVGKQRAEIIR